MPVDYRSYPVLFVDDEPQNQVAFRYSMEDQFAVLTASGGEEALRLLAEHDVAVLLTDQRMAQMTGVELCARASHRFPDVIRIIVTAYADIHAAIDAINKGHVSRYVLKPWRNEELVEVLQTSIDFVHLQKSMQEMELRLLRSDQIHVAEVVRNEFIHEFTNPLGALGMTLEHAVERGDSALRLLGAGNGEAAGRALAESIECQREAMAVVHELAELSHRFQRGDRPTTSARGASCDPARVVDATVRILRPELERVARLEVLLDAVPMAAIDASALGRVVLNLLLNAAQAIEGLDRAEHRITVAVTGGQQGIAIRIQDTGPGIPEPDRQRIFQPYVTTKEDGSGLGLSVVREAVLGVGGRIVVGEASGGGASFELHLPAS